MAKRIHITYVGDTKNANSTKAILEEKDDRFSVEIAANAGEVLNRLNEDIDCIVSEYDLARTNGIKFLEQVRKMYPELPFILFTSNGSAEVASDAVMANVTRYVPKDTDSDQHTTLTNQIRDTVEENREQQITEDTNLRLTQIAEKTDDILFVIDGDWGDFSFINSPSETVWGESITELEGTPETLLQNVHPEKREAARQSFRRASEGVSNTAEYPIVLSDGETKWVRVQSNPIFTHGELDSIVGFIRSIAEPTQKMRRLTTLVNNLPGIIYRCRNDWDMPMEYVEGDCESLTGYRAESLENQDVLWGDIVHPVDEERMWDDIDSGLEANEQFEVTYRIRAKDGTVKWMWERGWIAKPETDHKKKLEGFITDLTADKER